MVHDSLMAMSALDRKVVALLGGGFTLVILLMLATGQLGLEALRELGRGSTGLLNEERAGGRALSHAQELETEFDRVFYSVPGVRSPETVEGLRGRLEALESSLQRTARDGLSSSEPEDAQRWRDFEAAGLAFVAAVRASATPGNQMSGPAVSDAHQRVLQAVSSLADQSDRRNEQLVNEDRDAFAAAMGFSIRLLALTGGIAIVVAVATVLLVRRLFNQLAWQRAELMRLSSDILHTQEDTLRQVSHDLHDQIGQTLTAIEANLGALDAATKDWSVRGRVEDCIGLVQDLMSQTRTMSQLLRPSLLDDFGLKESIEPLVQSFGQRTGVEVSFRSNWPRRLDELTETHLYRIVQEALTNAARHSGATRVDVSLVQHDRTVELVIEDNGRGLPKAGPRSSGLGLRSMRARAEQIGGVLTMENPKGGGLRIAVRATIAETESYEQQDAIAVG
jgi:signal transduction histidine kinase